MQNKLLFIISMTIIIACECHAQGKILRHKKDNATENILQARVKNFDNFQRRFNHELDFADNTIDSGFYENLSRKEMIESLIYKEDPGKEMTDQKKSHIHKKFIKDVCEHNKFLYKDTCLKVLLNCSYEWNNNTKKMVFTLKYHEYADSSFSWVISGIETDTYGNEKIKDGKILFIPPNNDDLYFSRLIGALNNPGKFKSGQTGNAKSIELIKSKQFRFKSVDDMKYISTCVEGWKIELSDFNTPGCNMGWLISDIDEL